MKEFSLIDIVIPEEISKVFIYASRYYKKFPKNGKYSLDHIEELISKHGFASCQYARLVLGHRFHKGEVSISNCPASSYTYSKSIFGERWPPGEMSLMQSPFYACQYAIHVIKNRWQEAETVISSDESSREIYMLFLKDNGISTEGL
jgi:hypothetical protein